MSTISTFGVQLGARRRDCKLSMRMLAKDAGVALGTLSGLESGAIAAPSMDTAQKLAAFFGVPVSAMLGEEVEPVPAAAVPAGGQGEWMDYVSLDLIDFSPLNPRRTFDEDELRNLADSIAEKGVLQPVMLRPRDEVPGRFWLVMGERRCRAAKMAAAAGQTLPVPARVRPMTDAEHVELALVENMQRADVPPMEEAESIARLVDMRGGDTAAVAKAISRTTRHVQVALNLVGRLAPEVQEALRAGILNKEMARRLTLVDAEKQREVLDRVWDGRISNGAQLKSHLRAVLFPADQALFGRLEYNGPLEEDPDTSALFFTDEKLVRQLQTEAMKARAAELRADGYGAVKVVLDNPWLSLSDYRLNDEGYYQLAEGAKPKAGHQRAAILILKANLCVDIHLNMAKAPEGKKAPSPAVAAKDAAKASGDPLADLPKGAQLYARNARTMDLQDALFHDLGYRTLLAHLCLSLMYGADDGTDMLGIKIDERAPEVRVVSPLMKTVLQNVRDDLERGVPEPLFCAIDPFLRVRSEEVGKYGVLSRKRRARLLLERLYAQDASQLLFLAMALLACRAGTWYGDGINGEFGLGDKDEVLAAAGQLNLTQVRFPVLTEEYLGKLPAPALTVLKEHVGFNGKNGAMRGATWTGAIAKEKRAGLLQYFERHPEAATYCPALFRYASPAGMHAAIKAEANDVRQPAKAAE